MRRLFFLIVSISLAVPAVRQSKHPFTLEDMMKLKRVGEPDVSPAQILSSTGTRRPTSNSSR